MQSKGLNLCTLWDLEAAALSSPTDIIPSLMHFRTIILPSACVFALGLLAIQQLVHAAWLITGPGYAAASHRTE